MLASSSVELIRSVCGSTADEFDVSLDLEITGDVQETISRIFDNRAIRKRSHASDSTDTSKDQVMQFSQTSTSSSFNGHPSSSASLTQQLDLMNFLPSSQNVNVIDDLLSSDSDDSDCIIIEKVVPLSSATPSSSISWNQVKLNINTTKENIVPVSSAISTTKPCPAPVNAYSTIDKDDAMQIVDSDEDEFPSIDKVLSMKSAATSFTKTTTSVRTILAPRPIRTPLQPASSSIDKSRQERVVVQSEKQAQAASKKAERQLARKAVQEQEEAEKRIKRAHKEANKIRQKDDCMKEMIAVIAREFMESCPGADLISPLLEEAGGRCRIKTLAFPNIIQFVRCSKRRFNAEDDIWVACDEYEETEPYVLVCVHADDIANGIREKGDTYMDSCYKSISSKFPKFKIIFLVQDLDQYAAKKVQASKRKVNRSMRQVLNDDNEGATASTSSKSSKKKKVPAISLNNNPELFPEESEIDRQLFQLQFSSNGMCRVHTCRVQETPSWILTYTAQIGVEPELRYRSHNSLQLAFGDSIKSGRNMLDQWSRMLSQIPTVTEEKSTAIVEKYPTLQSLIRSYERAPSTEAAHDLLIGLKPKNSLRAASSIGKSVSQKVYDQLMGRNPKLSAI